MSNQYPAKFKQASIRNREIAKIKIAQQQLGWDDAFYRDKLMELAGVRSAKDLDFSGRAKVLKHMEKCGWKPTSVNKFASTDKYAPTSVRPECIALMSKVGALLADMKLPWKYAAAIGKRQTLAAGGIARLEWLDAEQLRAVVVALCQRQFAISNPQSDVPQ